MCTIAAAVGTDRRWPLVVAANRDERLRRPAESWALRHLPGGLRAVMPRDQEHGGSWIGVAETGLFVAITNYHSPEGRFPEPNRRSRGALVTAALGAGTLEEARAGARATDVERYNPFHLLVLQGAGGFLWRYDGSQTALEEVGPGLHLVTEGDPYGRGPRGEWLRDRWPMDLAPARLRQLLASHGEPARDYPCIHMGDVYGTRSASILRLAPSLAHAELYAADGPPCTAPLEDRSRLLAELASGRSPDRSP